MYYKDGIIASYMGLQFGVTYYATNSYGDLQTKDKQNIVDIYAVADLLNIQMRRYLYPELPDIEIFLPEYFIIHPDSYHIFEPQDGDKNIDGYVFLGEYGLWFKRVLTGENYPLKLPHELPISERNGKAFIMPERE